MSKILAPVGLAVEWSPKGVVAFDSASHRTSAYSPDDMLPFAGRSAVLALARGAVFVRTRRVPQAAHDEIRTILAMQIGDLFPLAANDLAFDFLLTSDVTPEGRLAVICAAPVVELRRALAQMKASGISVVRTVPAALGSALLAHALALPDAAVVESNEGGNSIDIVHQGSIILGRLAPATSPLEVEIARTCGLVELPCATILASGGMDLDIAQVRSDRTSLELLATTAPDRTWFDLELPEILANKAQSATRNRNRLAALMCVAAACLFTLAYFDYSDASNAILREKSRLSASVRQATAAQTAAESDLGKVVAINQTLNTAFTPAQGLSDIATTAVNAVPPGVWITGITLERGKQMLIRGTAKSNTGVSAYSKELALQSRFRNVKLVFANNSTIDKIPVVQFSISAFPVGNVPLAVPDTKASVPKPATQGGA